MHAQARRSTFLRLRTPAFLIHHIARHRLLSVTLIGLLGFAGSAVIGMMLGISEPMSHDEFSYLLAADTFAHLRLTNPSHPLWVHFESFHIIHEPTYVSKYPPGQGLALAIGQVLGGHPIVGAWMSFGFMCAAICWMLYGWMTPRWAVLGGILAVINPMLGIASYWAQSYWGGAVAASGGALLLGGVRRLMRPHACGALLTGAGLAVLANSRPYEGLLFSLPTGAFLLTWMLSKRGPSKLVSVQRIIIPILVVLILTAMAMGFYNLRATGSPVTFPYQVHEETYAIVPVFLWQDLRPEPAYRHPTIREFHVAYIPLYLAQYSLYGFGDKNIGFLWESAKYYVNVFLIPLLAAFWPLMLWTLRDPWARRALIVYAVLLVGLLMQTYTAVHYAAPITCLNYFFVVNAMRLWRRHHKAAGQTMLWLLPCLAITALVVSVSYDTLKKNGSSAWHLQRARLLHRLNQDHNRHLIIVKYGPQHSANDEWVYNEAEIDRAKVIWAREMDPGQNCTLIDHFTDRRVWLLEVGMDEEVPRLTPYSTELCRRQ